MIRHQSNVIHQLSESKSASKAYYRFYQNQHVSISEMVGHIVSPLQDSVSGRDVLVIGDSTQISLEDQVGDIRDAANLGVLGDNKTRGFHAHLNMVIDAKDGHGLGLSDLLLWNRKAAPANRSQAEKDASKRKRLWKEKESYKWYLGLNNSLEVLAKARRITYVFDAEADMGQLWDHILSNPRPIEALIRFTHDRPLAYEDGEKEIAPSKIRSYLDHLPQMGSYELALRGLKRLNYSRNVEQNRQARTAIMEVKFGKIIPKMLAHSPRPLYAVEAKEAPETVPEGEKPIHWILLTTHKVTNLEMAQQIILWYSSRWMIEQLFRLIKRQGMGIEETELEYVDSILKQTVASFEAAFRVMQLLLARDNPQAQQTQEVFTAKQIQCLKALNKKYEGKTQKLKNPYPNTKLSWATWIIGRLGGWKGYKKARPPGPIILKRGLKRFYDIFEGWKILYDKIDMGEP